MNKQRASRRQTRGKQNRGTERQSAAAPLPLSRWPAAAPWPPETALPAAALLLLTVAAYWPALDGGFVWDDNKFIVEEAAVREWGGLLTIWFNPAAMVESHYWPLLYTSFWLEHKLWGFNPAGFHAANILLHGINSVLLWRLLARIAMPGAWLIAAVFALHPVHAEAVAWIIARKDLLATFFYILAAGCWLRYRERPRTRTYAALLALYLAGTLSKTAAITLPAALLVWAWWRQGRITGRDAAQTAPLFLLGLCIGAYGIHHYASGGVIAFGYSVAERIIIAAKSLWFYAGKALWPEPLLFIYPHWDADPMAARNWLAPVAALALAAGLYLARGRIGRGPLAGALFFAITLAPALGFAPFRFMQYAFAADRYQYLAIAGIAAVVIGGAARLFTGGNVWGHAAADARGHAVTDVQGRAAADNRIRRYAGWALAAMLLAGCGALSFQRAHLFQDQVVLFRHVLATNPEAKEAGHILGTFLMERELWDEAEAAYRAAKEKDPAAIKIHVNLASVLMRLGRTEAAAEALREAVGMEDEVLRSRPDAAEARYEAAAARTNLGLALLQLNQLTEAEQSLRRALELEPGSREARHNLAAVLQRRAVAHYNAGRLEEAVRLFRRSIAFNPGDAQAHANLGAALGQSGRYREAVASFERALAIDPRLESARAYLELAREQLPK